MALFLELPALVCQSGMVRQQRYMTEEASMSHTPVTHQIKKEELGWWWVARRLAEEARRVGSKHLK